MRSYGPTQEGERKILGAFPASVTNRPRDVLASWHRHGHRLNLRIIAQCIFAQFAANAAHFEAAEGGGGVEDVVAVDPDGAGLELGGHAVGLADIAGPY